MLTAEKIQSNWKDFRDRVGKYFPSRSKELLNMYDELEEVAVMAPASSFEHFHNAIPGGYIDHVLRVHDNAILLHKVWNSVGINCNFNEEELHFAALHHDLGKLGLPGFGNEHYQPNPSDWHVKNQGKVYQTNPNIPKMNTADRSFFLLNFYGIKYSLNEMLGIKLTDGMYDEANKEYYSGFGLETKLRNPLPYILHHADMMALRFEFDRFVVQSEKFKTEVDLGATPPQTVKVSDIPKSRGPKDISLDLFDQMFQTKS